MSVLSLKSIMRRPPVIIANFGEQEKAVARNLYRRGPAGAERWERRGRDRLFSGGIRLQSRQYQLSLATARRGEPQPVG
jgi:hypothetical protein